MVHTKSEQEINVNLTPVPKKFHWQVTGGGLGGCEGPGKILSKAMNTEVPPVSALAEEGGVKDGKRDREQKQNQGDAVNREHCLSREVNTQALPMAKRHEGSMLYFFFKIINSLTQALPTWAQARV